MRATETESGCSALPRNKPLVIAHRGASGERPEHTLAAYRLAIEQGADFIEPDLVVTRDGALIARHENELSGTTDVASLPGFRHLKTRKQVDGRWVEGWFSEDFTLDEIRCLRARERIPEVRPDNARFDGHEFIPTLEDIVELVRASQECGRPVGIYPETKHPSYFAFEGHGIDGQRIGRSLGQMLINELKRLDFVDPERVFIQSFELGNLIELSQSLMPSAGLELPLILLLPSLGEAGSAQPYDVASYAHLKSDLNLEDLVHALGLSTPAQIDYAGLLSENGLAWLKGAGVAGLGPSKHDLLNASGFGSTSPLEWMQTARELSMHVHPYTLRAEAMFLTPTELGCAGTIADEIERLLAVGVSGFFTDHTALGVRVRDEFVSRGYSGKCTV